MMEPTVTDRQDFIDYPTNRVVGTIADAKSARAAIDALLHAGFTREDIDILHGEADLQRLDLTGTDHGFLAQFQRTLLRAAGPNEEYRYLRQHFEDVRAGRFVIMVLARERDRRTIAADILNDQGAEFVGFYGRWAWQGLPSHGQAPPPSAAGGSSDHSAAAGSSPTAIVKRMFAAFGARDLDALIATVHPDSRWSYYGANPQRSKAEFSGRSEVRRFFERILQRLDITAFNTDQFVTDGDTVVIFGSESGTVRATGQRFRNEWAQKYLVQDGLIVEMAEYNIQVEPQG